MNKNDCYQLGHITRTHGVKGELVFFLDVDYPNEYADLESVFIEIKGELLPYFIEKINIQKDSKAIVKLEEVDTIEAAQKLINCPLFMPDEVLDDLSENDFYYHEIKGFMIEDQALGALGTVTDVYTMNIQDLIGMKYKGAEVLIPINDQIILKLDRDAQVIHVNLPEGLVDLYLNDTPSIPDDAD
jgi:16S rRNA processing protein RimM